MPNEHPAIYAFMATHLAVWNKAIDKGQGAKLDFPQ